MGDAEVGTMSRSQREGKSRSSFSMQTVVLVLLLPTLISTSPWLIRTLLCNSWTLWDRSSFCAPSSTPWNLIQHLGGNGPWIPYRRTQEKVEDSLPPGCLVDQVHMISRHAERYPTRNAGQRHHDLLNKLQNAGLQLRGPLAFAREWQYFIDFDAPHFEDLTFSGPFAGTLQAYSTGQKLRTRYTHLLSQNRPTNFWTCSSPRDIETAKCFARGFFGLDWEQNRTATLNIIPETPARGANTLTPGRSCLKYRVDKEYGRDIGYAKLAEFQEVMARSINARFQLEASTPLFSPLEIYGMMEFCGFEMMVRGSSPWCEVFTQEEWLAYEYGRDLLHFYRSGPGNRYARSMGWLWLNATTEQMTNRSASGVYFSFVHDGDIMPILASMGIMDEPGDVQFLPSDRVHHGRRFKTSDVVPMGGRLIFEKVNCVGNKDQPHPRPGSYIRLFINDGLFDLGQIIQRSSLTSGVELTAFEKWIDAQGHGLSFREACGLNDSVPWRISFLHQ